jgi:hypothetical protein
LKYLHPTGIYKAADKKGEKSSKRGHRHSSAGAYVRYGHLFGPHTSKAGGSYSAGLLLLDEGNFTLFDPIILAHHMMIW